MKIAYINDQIFPTTGTDTEQIMSVVSSIGDTGGEVGGGGGADVTLILPRKWRKKTLTAKKLAEYYEITLSFNLHTIPSAYSSFRAVEKTAHAVASIYCAVFKNADVVYTRNVPMAISALIFSRKPVIYETYRPWPDQILKLRPLYRWMVVRKRLLGVITHSSLAANSFLGIGLHKEKLLIAYNGYHPSRMEPRLTRSEARRQVGLCEQGRLVVYAGRVSIEKGVETILYFAEKMTSVQFAIVGSQGEGEIEGLGKHLPNLKIVPRQPFRKTTPYLYAADVLLIPPTKIPLEKFGNTVLPIKTFLYMAAGRTIFGPATPDLREMLEDNRNAVLVEPDKPEMSLERLKQTLSDDSLLNRLGEQAKADVSDFTWGARAIKVLNFIQRRLRTI